MKKIDPNNKNIASLLEDIGAMLDILGKDRFRVLAYQKAADVIKHHPQELSELYRSEGIKGLEELEGVGEGIAKKIEELIKTGKLRYHQQLANKVPPIERLLLEIPGVGPKTAHKIYQKLKPKDLADLKKKLKKIQKESLTPSKANKFFGSKTVGNILEGIEIKKRLGGRHLLSIAEPIAQAVTSFLVSLSFVKVADAVGSLRRKKDTVGDIDIVAATTNRLKTINAFSTAPFVSRVVNAGDTKATIIDKNGLQIDLEIVPSNEYGNLLQHFTGSKEHNVALRTWALKKDLSISEHGIKHTKTNKIFKTSQEEEVYRHLGMPWIPPELREDRGEITAALNKNLPRLITVKDIRGNLHTHSTVSDGASSMEEMIKAALAAGLEYIVMSDHSSSIGITGGITDKTTLGYVKNIRNLDKNYSKKGIRVLSGVELSISASGTVDLKDSTLKMFDFVLASIHSSFRQKREITTRRLLKAIENPYIDCIGHPSGRMLGKREGIDADWPTIFKAAAKTGTLLEISAQPARLDLPDYLVFKAKKMGVQFTINADAHHNSHFSLLSYGVSVARRGWLEKKDVINTKTTKEFLSWLEKRSNGK